MKNKQPKIKIISSEKEKFIELFVLICVFCAVLAGTYIWRGLPDTIPVHFDLKGQVDGYGNKAVVLSMLPLIIILYALLTFLQRIPHVYNYVVKITEENAEKQYRLAVAFMRTIKFEIVALFSYLYLITALSAKEGKMILGIWFVPVTIIVLFATIGIYMTKSLKSKQ